MRLLTDCQVQDLWT